MNPIYRVMFRAACVSVPIGIAAVLGGLPMSVYAQPLRILVAQMSADDFYRQGVFKEQLEGDRQGAIENYTQAIRLNPNHVEAYNDRGLARFALGDKQGAIEDYTQAIRLNSNHAEVYNNRGLARFALGDQQRAIEDYTQAIRINPLLEEAYLNLTEVYNKRGLSRDSSGDKPGAIEDYTQAIQTLHKMPSSPRSNLRGNRQGAAYNLAMTYYNRGLARHKSGDKSGSIKDLQKAAQLFYSQDDRANYQLVMNKIREFQR